MIEDIFKKTFKRRSFILGVGKSVLLWGLISRLIYLQIFNREHYQILADKNRIVDRLISPVRGQIIDDSGNFLAINHDIYRCLISSEIDMDDIIAKNYLSDILHLNSDFIEGIFKKLKKNTMPLVLKENISWDEMASLQLRSDELPAIIIEKSQGRKYLYPEALCHIVGYISQASEKDFKEYTLDSIPGLKIGKSGLEKTFQDVLKGNAGKQRIEVNAKRRMVRVIDNLSPVTGNNVRTTINLNLQLKVHEILKSHKRASAIVMDVQTGAIKALVSQPGYDANLFVPGISKSDWQILLKHEDRPLTNKAISAQYAPGSTFKMIVAFAALKEGIITSKTEFCCPGHYDLGAHRFHCWAWKIGGHGFVNLESAISRSCDTYFYHLALLLGSLKISEMAQKFFLGALTRIELPGEKKGLIPTKDWAKFRKGFFSQKGNALNISIGQGVLLTTPLQLARMTAMIANNGKIITPHLVASAIHTKDEFLSDMEPEWYRYIQQAMLACVNSPSGTAHLAKPNCDYVISGKTGSSQVSRITIQQRQDGTYKDLPYQLKDHASFVGFAPFESPKHVVSVVIEHGGSGGKVAAPIGTQILLEAKNYCL